jgi:hypothetical protein
MTDYYEYNWRRIGAVIAVAVVIGFLVWLLVIRDDDGEDSGAPGVVVAVEVQPFGPALGGAGELKDAAAQVGHPVYWAGRDQEGDIEVTLTADGRTFVRYLTGGAAPGDEAADFLTVATYEVENAESALQDVAGREGRESFAVPGGGLAVADAAQPQRVYFTPAGSDLQVEVFDPEPGRAQELVASGQIQPLD